MDEKEYFDEAEYIRGFNLGYRVSKEFPDVGGVFDMIRFKSDKLDGIKDGREQYLEDLQKEKALDLERSQSNRPDFLTKNRFDSPSLDRDTPERDLDIDKE